MKKYKSAIATEVRTIDLKTILNPLNNNRPILIKLDVEGAEIDAIKGLGDLAGDLKITIIYEEVEKDCGVTAYLQSRMDREWHIWNIASDGVIVEIDHHGAQEIACRASGPSNFVATNFVATSQRSAGADVVG
jgi:hypothetical protein